MTPRTSIDRIAAMFFDALVIAAVVTLSSLACHYVLTGELPYMPDFTEFRTLEYP